MFRALPRLRPLPLLALLVLAPASRSAAEAPAPPPRFARPSWALEDMLRERVRRGEPVPESLVRRFALDRAPFDADPAEMGAAPALPKAVPPGGPAGFAGFGLDRLVNDPLPDAGSCAGCGFLNHIQSETTIAAWGPYLLAGWNDSRGFCDNTSVSGWGWSVDGGATWFDAGGVPPLPTGGRYRGDPVHAVNRKSGEFYVAALYEGGANGSGLACLRGHFSGGSLVVDGNRQIAVGAPDFLDKEWIAVDSLSGNVYASWTAFTATGDQIDFRAYDAALNPLGPVQTLSSPAADGLVQGSRPVVGPDGVLYVVWLESGTPESHLRIRRSNDFGATFGAEQTVADFHENYLNGAPGFLREFTPNLPSIAVDASRGPHRGRVHVAWDETVNFHDAPFTAATARVELENNGFFASATPFVVGDVLRGSIASGDLDFFRFTGSAGQTLVMRGDSAASGVGLALRLVCLADTSTFNAYRIQAYTASDRPMIVYTLPAGGTYYARLSPTNATAGAYTFSTAWDTPSAGERASHNREKFAAWSDDGATWSTPVRVDDTSTTDGVFPELAVDDLGRVWCSWHDFRDDPACAAESYEVIAASGDGGISWGPNQRLSDARSFWPPNTCRKPNQGDYQGITAIGDRVIPCWADARLGDPDTWTEAIGFASEATCPGEVALASGAQTGFDLVLTNAGTAPAELAWTVAGPPEWIVSVTPSAAGSAEIAAGAGMPIHVTVRAPAGCAGTSDTLELIRSHVLIAGRADTCRTVLRCTGPVAVGGDGPRRALELMAPRPNPSGDRVEIAFTLPGAGPARLEIYGETGRRIRTLCSGSAGAGPHAASWDGRDERGRRVAPGAYWVKLEFGGETRVARVVRMR